VKYVMTVLWFIYAVIGFLVGIELMKHGYWFGVFGVIVYPLLCWDLGGQRR